MGGSRWSLKRSFLLRRHCYFFIRASAGWWLFAVAAASSCDPAAVDQDAMLGGIFANNVGRWTSAGMTPCGWHSALCKDDSELTFRTGLPSGWFAGLCPWTCGCGGPALALPPYPRAGWLSPRGSCLEVLLDGVTFLERGMGGTCD